jgi:hypothetical protein
MEARWPGAGAQTHILRPRKRGYPRLPRPVSAFVFEVGIDNNCLADCVMRRFSEVKHRRIAQLAGDMVAAALGSANDRELEATE